MLGLLAAVMGALLALGAAERAWPRQARLAALALCGVGVLTDLGYLLAGAAPASLDLPVGLPGSGLLLALDGLSGFFLLLVLLVGAAVSAAMLDEPARGAGAGLAPLLGAMTLALLAGDGFGLALGVAATALAGFAVVLEGDGNRGARPAARLMLGTVMPGLICLAAAIGLLAHAEPRGIDLGFAAMRASPPEGARALAVLALALAGAGSLAALAPLHFWLAPAQQAAPAPAAVLIGGGMTKLGLYLLARVVFDLCGPAQPGWWGIPLIALGTAGAVSGTLRAALAPDFTAVLAGATAGSSGLVAVGLGLGLAARGADLPAVASLAMAAALLLAVASGLVETLLGLAAGAVARGAGTRRLDRLGGLIHAMPATSLCVMAGAASLAALPPSAGFAGVWLLLQAVLAAPRIGGIGLQILVAVVAAATALAVALGAAAAVRLVGVACLGRPRTPRAAAAQEAPRATRMAMAALAGLAALIGLFPALVLRLAGPALRLVAGAGMADRAGAWTIAPQTDAPGYGALGVAILLGLALTLVWGGLRWRAAPGHRTAPAWDGGFAPPPPWLPFGDPATQMTGAGFAEPLRRTLGVALPGDPAVALLLRPTQRLHRALSLVAERIQNLPMRRSLAVALSVLALLLAALVAAEL